MARLGRLALGVAVSVLVGCTGAGVNTPTPSAVGRQAGARGAVLPARAATTVLPPAPAGLRPPLDLAVRQLRTLGATRDLVGTASFSVLDESYFRDSAATYRLQAAPVGRAMVTVTALDEALYARDGQVVRATTDASGTYRLAGGVPADESCVVNVTFAGGHRLSAIAPAGAASRDVDEASTLVAEMARWQLRPDASTSGPSVQDVSSAALDAVEALTRSLLASELLPVTPGDLPSVEALQVGAGHRLRNAYVEAFGSRVTGSGTSLFNQLANAWRDILGFQPLALTRVAGVGIRGYSQSDDKVATEAQLVAPMHAAMDEWGHVYLSQYDVQLVSMVPGSGLTGPIYGEDQTSLGAGKLYTIGGVVNGPKDPNVWEQVFRGVASETLGDGVPMYDTAENAPQGFPLYSPHKLALERAPAVQRSHVYFTQPFTGRVMLMPADDSLQHFGRPTPYASRSLYVVAGNGPPPFPLPDNWSAEDDQPATAAGLFFPTGLTRDADGNLWLIDAGNGAPGTGGLLVVREADGHIFRIPLTLNNQPFTPDGALDLALSPDGTKIYVADTERHWIFKLHKPTVPEPTEPPLVSVVPIERVAGRQPTPAQPFVYPGFIDTALRPYPSIYDVSRAEPEASALLNRPGSLCFDAAGNLLIGDTGNGRIRLKKSSDLASQQPTELYTIAGGLDTRYLTGDARLAYLPATGYLSLDKDNNVLVTDRREAVVRRLHTVRGSLLPPP